jgi:hypothetical protein
MPSCVKITHLGYAVSLFKDNLVAIGTVYRLDGLYSILGGGKIFSSPQRPTEPPIQWLQGQLPQG